LLWWWFRALFNNAGLCGPVVSMGTVGTSYYNGVEGTNLGNDCPTIAPSASPTSSPTIPATATPTSSPTATRSPTSNKPCCDVMRQNPLFACMEERWPLMAQGTCQECGGGTGK